MVMALAPGQAAAQADVVAEQTIAHNTKIQIYFTGIPVGKLKFYYNFKQTDYQLIGGLDKWSVKMSGQMIGKTESQKN